MARTRCLRTSRTAFCGQSRIVTPWPVLEVRVGYACIALATKGNTVRSIHCFLVVSVLATFSADRRAEAHSAWVEQTANIRPTAYVSQTPTHLRRSLASPAAAPPQTRRQVRRAAPVRQQESAPARQEAILDLGDVLDTSRLPSVREGVRVLGLQR